MRLATRWSFFASIAFPSIAAAQTAPDPSARPPSSGEPTGLPGYNATAPLRLSLVGSVFPVASQFPQCAALGDDVGNSVGGIPVQHYEEVHLVGRLVLSAFSRLGCPIDAGAGAALSYVAPLRSSTWLVLGGGAYAAPGQMPLYGGLANALANVGRSGSPLQAAMRADVMWKTRDDRTMGVGVESRPGRQQVFLSGGF